MLVAIYGTAIVGSGLAWRPWAGDSRHAAVAALGVWSGFIYGHMVWFAASTMAIIDVELSNESKFRIPNAHLRT